MWDRPNRSHFYGRSYRRAPPKLIPAIITCQVSVCLIFFGIFLLIAGCIMRFVVGDDSHFDEHQKEFLETPRTIGAIIITIAVIMIGCSIISIVIAFVCYQKYETLRRKQSQIPSQILTNYETSAPSITPAVDYPTQAGYQYQPGYQPVSQNVVYNPTTEPNLRLT